MVISDRQFRYLKRRRQLALGEHEFPQTPHRAPEHFVARVDQVRNGSIASLRRALNAVAGQPWWLGESDDIAEYFEWVTRAQLELLPAKNQPDETTPHEVTCDLSPRGDEIWLD